MKVDDQFLILEGQEVFAFNRLYSHLMANIGIRSAMKKTWTETNGLPVDSRAAVTSAALRTFAAYVLVKALRQDMNPLEAYETAMEQAKILLAPEKDPSQSDKAVEGGRLPSTGDAILVGFSHGSTAQISAKLKPAGRFKMALVLSKVLSEGTD